VQTVRNNPARIREVNNEIEQLGATVKAQWATLGHFDFVNVVEAPDDAAHLVRRGHVAGLDRRQRGRLRSPGEQQQDGDGGAGETGEHARSIHREA